MSLGSVPNEETDQLMGDFYRRLKAGAGKSEALHRATLALMRARREKHGAVHPFYWGPQSDDITYLVLRVGD